MRAAGLPGRSSSSEEPCGQAEMLLGACVVLSLLPLLRASPRGFTPCPESCLCYEASDLVDCRARGLWRVPPGVPHGSWMLDMRGNKLLEVHSRSFPGLWALKVLLMANNSIEVVRPQSLSSLQFLEMLDLSFNRLQRLPLDFSRSLSSLLELRLDHNLLQELEPASLEHLENLKKLDLSYNRLQALGVGAFSRLSVLRVLSLEGNRLQALGAGVLRRQRRLEVLLLGRNNISSIEVDSLAPLQGLTLLDLRANRLSRVRFKTLLQLGSSPSSTTTHLHMASNPWTCDCELQRVFTKIQRVRRLHVSDFGAIVCGAPAQLAGTGLASLHGRLCLPETAALLIITGTVGLAVIGALIRAEQNRKNSAASSEAEQDK